MLVGRILGWFVVIFGLLLLGYGFTVPAFVAASYLQGGAVLLAGGVLLIYLFRDKKKQIEKEARKQAEIEKRKRALLDDDSN